MRINRRIGVWLLGIGIAVILTIVRAEESLILPAGTVQHSVDTLRWTKGPPSMPPGSRIVLLEGDPKTEGLYTIRLSIPAGARLPSHWHPRDERVTVLSGRIGVGFGDRFDNGQLRYFDAGSYYVNPAHSHHYVYFPEATVVQVTGMGPWETHLVPAKAAHE